MEKDRVLILASLIENVLSSIECLKQDFSIKELEIVLKDMEHESSILQAMPFPSTINKGDLNEKKNKTFRLIIELIKNRKAVQLHQNKFLDEKELKVFDLL